jgi:hypothetical protein
VRSIPEAELIELKPEVDIEPWKEFRILKGDSRFPGM